MKNKLIIAAIFLVTSSIHAVTPFDALGAKPTPAQELDPASMFTKRAQTRLRSTYQALLSAYESNAAVIKTIPSQGAITREQATELITVQWWLYNVLKSINPELTVPLPGATPAPTVSTKPEGRASASPLVETPTAIPTPATTPKPKKKK